MATLQSLPPDQRAVLQLVLQRGRTYDQIASMLSIDRAAVRDRALAAFDALGPQTRVAPERRALITDYLLGQLPPIVADQVYERLATSPSERAWARIMSSELATLARGALPEIPTGSTRRTPPAAAAPVPATPAPARPAPAPTTPRTPAPAAPAPAAATPPAPAAVPAPAPAPSAADYDDDDDGYGRRDAAAGPPVSRRGGWIFLAVLLVAIVVIVIAVLVATNGSNNKSSSSTSSVATRTGSTSTGSATGASTSDTGTTASTPSTSTTASSSKAKVISQFSLSSPGGGKSPYGKGEVVKESNQEGVVLYGIGVAANTKHNAYAVWLTNGGSSSHLLGFVTPAVTKNGDLKTAGLLPSNAATYKQLVVTLETTPKPKTPGTIVLQGEFTTK
jgi:hypothetical protein